MSIDIDVAKPHAAEPIVAEAEVLPHRDGDGAESVGQDPLDELLRAERCEVRREPPIGVEHRIARLMP